MTDKTEWKDISTAPRGKDVLVWCDEWKQVTIARLSDGYGKFSLPSEYLTFENEAKAEEADAFAREFGPLEWHDKFEDSVTPISPIYWMSLPDPPREQEPEE